jgi:hypothetical protein
LLCRVLACADADLPALLGEVRTLASPQSVMAFSQVAAARLLTAGNAETARTLLESLGPPSGPPWHLRTRLILRSWRLLHHAAAELHKHLQAHKLDRADDRQAREQTWNSDTLPRLLRGLSSCAQELGNRFPSDHDNGPKRWRLLLTNAIELASNPGKLPTPQAWLPLAPWPLAYAPALWAADPAVRNQAADQLLPGLAALEGRPGGQRFKLLLALAQLARRRPDNYLESYAALEPVLDQLPVDGVNLWLAAARIWLARQNWPLLLEAKQPPFVSDPADVRPRMVIASACVRAALQAKDQGQPRVALKRIQQARLLLGEVLGSRAGGGKLP